jgi:hypothetical protein
MDNQLFLLADGFLNAREIKPKVLHSIPVFNIKTTLSLSQEAEKDVYCYDG